jgi:hypothetical protein
LGLSEYAHTDRLVPTTAAWEPTERPLSILVGTGHDDELKVRPLASTAGRPLMLGLRVVHSDKKPLANNQTETSV